MRDKVGCGFRRLLASNETPAYNVHVSYIGNTVVVILQVVSSDTLARLNSSVQVNLLVLIINKYSHAVFNVLTCRTHMPYVLPRILCVSA